MALPLIPIAAGMCAPGCAGAAAAAATALGGGALLTTAAPVLAVGAGAAAMYSYMKSGKGSEENQGDDGEEFYDPIAAEDGGESATGDSKERDEHAENGRQEQDANKEAKPLVGVEKRKMGIQIHGLHSSSTSTKCAENDGIGSAEDAHAAAEGKKIAAAFF